MALSLTVLEGSDTAWTLATGSGLVGTVLLDAVLGREYGKSFFDLFDVMFLFVDGVEAVIVRSAFHEVGSILLFLFLETFDPAVVARVAFVMTEFQGSNAPSIIVAGVFFLCAVISDALLGISK